MCNRCETDVAEYWCDSDCKHCFCSKCWQTIHEVGQYRNHTKLPVKDRPIDMPRCEEHEHDDDKLKYWCEKCTKEICSNCQQFKHKDHPLILVTGYVKSLEEQVSIKVKFSYITGFKSIYYSVSSSFSLKMAYREFNHL
jgi:hypothetical protein